MSMMNAGGHAMILHIEPTEEEACQELLTHYGPRIQTAKAAEESAELAAAYARILSMGATCATLKALALEIADVQIMTRQMFTAYPGLEPLVYELRPQQLSRALDRIHAEQLP